ncbi:MAG: sensor histidine kinase [Sphingobacteriales bacterium]|nr:MAG: sensor histidine kinase [Sphingobacteriales bacterium]
MQNEQFDIYVMVILGMAGTFLLGTAIVFFYIRYRWQFYKQKESLQLLEMDHQKALLAASVHTQDEERKRIGRDLHDEIGSMLSSLRLHIQRVIPNTDKDIKADIDGIISRVRDISHQLLPPGIELFGLADALEELCENIAHLSGVEIIYSNKAEDMPKRLHNDVALSLYRVIQELLNNTLKHADATLITVSMQQAKDELHIIYTDNGKGFDTRVAGRGMGLYNIKSRLQVINASCDIQSGINKGCSIHICYKET